MIKQKVLCVHHEIMGRVPQEPFGIARSATSTLAPYHILNRGCPSKLLSSLRHRNGAGWLFTITSPAVSIALVKPDIHQPSLRKPTLVFIVRNILGQRGCQVVVQDHMRVGKPKLRQPR